MINNSHEIIMKVLLATFLSGLVGAEREIRSKDAGLRTHILVAVGSTLIVLTSLYLSDIYKTTFSMDPTRMITGVVQGIGFLCGGAILHAGATSVKGLTTAATLWIVSGIGIAVGAGDYISAVVVTLVVLLVLLVVWRVEAMIHDYGKKKKQNNS